MGAGRHLLWRQHHARRQLRRPHERRVVQEHGAARRVLRRHEGVLLQPADTPQGQDGVGPLRAHVHRCPFLRPHLPERRLPDPPQGSGNHPARRLPPIGAPPQRAHRQEPVPEQAGHHRAPLHCQRPACRQEGSWHADVAAEAALPRRRGGLQRRAGTLSLEPRAVAGRLPRGQPRLAHRRHHPGLRHRA